MIGTPLVRSSIKFLHFVPFHQQIWPPRAILVSDWLLFKKIFSSENPWQNGAKLGRKHLCKILYKASSLVPFGQQTWPPRLILFSDWLMLKKSSLKQLGQMEPNLAGSIYVRSSIKLFHLVPFGQQTWPLLLKIEHMIKLHVFGNNSKTINNIRNLTGFKWSAQQDLTTLKFWRKSDYLSWSYCPFFIKFSKFLNFLFFF